MRIVITAALGLVISVALAQDGTRDAAGFLAKSQLQPSGAWPADKTGVGHVGATAQVVLSYLGAGYTDRGSKPHAERVRGGLAYLLVEQQPSGRIAADLASHALATLALSEAHTITRSPLYGKKAREAVAYLVSQQKQDGSFGDLLTTAWSGMALHSARLAGLKPDPNALAKLHVWTSKATGADGIVRGLGDEHRATAAVTLLRVFFGESKSIAKSIAFLVATPPDRGSIDEVYVYFATLVVFQQGGRDWRAWNVQLKAAVTDAQKKPAGDWDPGPRAIYGRVGATALQAMTLQVYYRYQRVFGLKTGNAVVGIGGGAGGAFRGRGGRRNFRAAGGSARRVTHNTEAYDRIVANDFRSAWDEATSTFSVDVDTASYANVRGMLMQNRKPPADSVRIEEMVNYFTYDYPEPAAQSPHPLAANVEIATCPWNGKHRLVRIGLQAPRFENRERPPSNLVFLLDVSGSMKSARKLPLLKRAVKLMVAQLAERDSVAIVVYASAAGLVLPPTKGSDKATILAALDKLKAGGSTAGGAGIQLAYKTAREGLIDGGINRVLLCTDGDFNVGVSDRGSLSRLVEEQAKSGVDLSIFGFGMGNYKDGRLEELSNKGNGNYAYIDTFNEARKVFVGQLAGTLWTLAKDAKIQVFFNPRKVASWRLIGYENRLLKKEDFNDDKKDAGEIGAGHSVTALYEIVPAGAAEAKPRADANPFVQPAQLSEVGAGGALLRLRVRYKPPHAAKSILMEQDVHDGGIGFDAATTDFRWAAAVAEFAMVLRASKYKGDATFESVEAHARAALGRDGEGYRQEFLKLVALARAAPG